MYLTVLILASLGEVSGHGAMTYPTPRTNHTMAYSGLCRLEMGIPGTHIHAPSLGGYEPVDVTCSWYSEGCIIGCNECSADCGVVEAAFKKCCPTQMEPTLPENLRTYQNFAGRLDIGMKYNPWRAPGFSPVMDPCGVVSGGQNHAPYYHPSIKDSTKGSQLPELPGPKPIWPQGSEQDVAWNIIANHGGGYAYRLCPKSSDLTEDCFQRGHLEFAGNTSWIQWGDDPKNRTAFPAERVSEGTNPAGSQWTKNPIAPCDGEVGGASAPFNFPLISNCNKAMFPPILSDVVPAHPPYFKLPGLYGYGIGSIGQAMEGDTKKGNFFYDRFRFSIFDKVKIPKDLAPGDYVLSWRWDTEQTPQVWANCADITVTASEVMV